MFASDYPIYWKLTPMDCRGLNTPYKRRLNFELLENRALLASVAWDNTGDLIYQPNALADRIPDFSNVGYQGGIVALPIVASKVTVVPGAGDDTALIQAAIDQVEAMPLNANGFRGAVLLRSGEYQISGQLTIQASGVILRGEGDGLTETVLRATGTTQRTLIKATGSGSRSTVSGTTHNFVDKYVPVGARSFTLDSVAGLSVGETIMINRPTTAAWINEIGMNLLDIPWTPGSNEQDWDRVITRVEDNVITVDAPLTNSLDLNYGGGNIHQYTWPGRLNNIGVESLRGVSDYVSTTDTDHATWFIEMTSLQNGWVREITSEHFRQGLVTVTGNSKWVTVEDSNNLTPKSPIIGGERYSFNVDGQLVLVQNCYSNQGRHDYVLGSATPGPNVFVQSSADSAFADSGPHHRYSTGALFDNLNINGNQINVQNRGNLGTGHGWAGANMVIWNSSADSFVIQNPPTAQNWLIGSSGPVASGTYYVGPHAPGTVESLGIAVQPRSLYQAQLQERLAHPSLDYREYWVGDIDNFYSADGTGNSVGVNAIWRSQFDTATMIPLSNFDNLIASQAIPFTLDFGLAAGETIVGATLSLGMRATSSDVSGNRIYLDSLTDNPTFASLGWTDIATTGTTTKVLNLKDRLSVLQDGRLNVGLLANTAIDWVVLNLQVAPTVPANSTFLFAEADATVRGGTYANQNFGSDTVLWTKEDSSADFDRRAFFRFNLSSIQGEIVRATLKLVPTNVGATIENSVAQVDNDTWSESTISWNTQPSAIAFGSSMVSLGDPFEILVTPLAQQSLNTDRKLSLRIESTTNNGGIGLVSYASRENSSTSLRPVLVVETKAASVANRQIFYNRSTSTVFGNGKGNPINAIDATKLALLQGQTSSFASYSNYVRGLNGLIVDIANLPGTITVGDFQFMTWNGVTAGGFLANGSPPTITSIPGGGSGGSTRIKIEFADNAIRDTWLRVTMLASANTGLATNDVFYFGHAMGDANVGNSGLPITVRNDEADALAIRQNQSLAPNSASVSNTYDVNKDGRINPIDIAIVRQYRSTRSLLRHFTAPVSLNLSSSLTATTGIELSIPLIGLTTLSLGNPNALGIALGSPASNENAQRGRTSSSSSFLPSIVLGQTSTASARSSRMTVESNKQNCIESIADSNASLSESLLTGIDHYFATSRGA